jgi:HlyD family secretion protein
MIMKKKKILTLVIVIGLLAIALPAGRLVGGLFLRPKQIQFKFAEISRGDIRKTVSSTGPLSPTTKIEVGSQVSGTIAKVLVNFNDKVQKDQVLAVLDMSLLKAEVSKAEGQLMRKEAELEDAQNDYKRNLPLFEKGVIPDSQMLTSKVKVKILEGEVKTGQAMLDFARRNLEYATIRSPIAGTVITKEVEEGQTLAANFMTPRLFEIAEDLSRMEILVAVDESDIGLIRQGQKVRFQVQAYADKDFSGVVKKVRLQPQKVANVVNYIVEVDAQNKDGLFLPGMTAEVDFIIAQQTNVLTVPKTALNFEPDKETLRGLAGRLDQTATARLAVGQADTGDEKTGYLWYLNEKDQLAVEQVQTGISDGNRAELLNPGRLHEGTKVISGVVETDEAKQSGKSTNKKVIGMPGGGGGGGPPPPGP